MLPATVDTFFLYAGIVPWSKEVLQAKLQAVGQDLGSPLASTLAVMLYRQQNGRPVKLLPQERKEDGLGLGHLPLLELIGPGILTFPTHEAIEQELVEFLRTTNPTNNVSPARLVEMYSAEGFPTTATGRIAFELPGSSGGTGEPSCTGHR